MKKNKKRITDDMQTVAVDILTRIIIAEWDGKPVGKEFFDEVMKDYLLWDDPFTHLPCTTFEYQKLSEEYNRQLMEERFGYYD